MAEISTVLKNTPMTTTNSFPNFSDFSKLAIDEAIVKKTNGIMAVKSKFKNISPSGFITSTSLPKTNPNILPAVIPHNNQIIPLYVLNKLVLFFIFNFYYDNF